MNLHDFDPVKWLDDLLATLALGRGVKLTWAKGAATGAQVEMMLRKYGVKVYARQYTDKGGRPYGVTVRAEQEIWAQYLLDRFLSGGEMPTEWGVPAKPQGFGGVVVDFFTGGFE